jgi:hypothetical protein
MSNTYFYLLIIIIITITLIVLLTDFPRKLWHETVLITQKTKNWIGHTFGIENFVATYQSCDDDIVSYSARDTDPSTGLK